MGCFCPCGSNIPRLANQLPKHIGITTEGKFACLNLTVVSCTRCGEANKETINADEDDQVSCVNKNAHNNNIKDNNAKCE